MPLKPLEVIYYPPTRFGTLWDFLGQKQRFTCPIKQDKQRNKERKKTQKRGKDGRKVIINNMYFEVHSDFSMSMQDR